ncbi:MAG: Hsp20 family protein [Nitrososphaerales archaeon]|jgi:HSP20 family protein
MSEDSRKNLRDMLDELDKYFEEFEKDVQDVVRNSVSAVRSQTEPYVAGFSFRLGPEGRPNVQFFGDSPLHHDGFRSPMSEQILDEKNGLLRLVLDMPGVEKSDIQVEATDDRAVVTAERGSRKYKADIGLKAQIQPDDGRAEYKNGVLEISFSLRDKTNKGYRRVNIV